jgi:hypothetical protein
VAGLERAQHRQQCGGLGGVAFEQVDLQREPGGIDEQPDLDLRVDQGARLRGTTPDARTRQRHSPKENQDLGLAAAPLPLLGTRGACGAGRLATEVVCTESPN